MAQGLRTFTINEGSIGPKPMEVHFGEYEKSSVTFVADSSGSLNSTYFTFEAITVAGVAVPYYVWFNINSLGVDPTVSGKTGVAVTGATNATAAALATAAAAAITALDNVTCTASDGVITILNDYMGDVSATADSAGAATGFTFSTTTAGFGGSLGATTGGVEVTLGLETVMVTADQYGTTKLGEVVTGFNAEVALSILELTPEKFATILSSGIGDTYLPGGGTRVYGIGSSKLFRNLNSSTGRLVMKPVGATDNSEIWTVWKAIAKPDSISFVGDASSSMPITFGVYIDDSKREEISVIAYGDSFQDLSA